MSKKRIIPKLQLINSSFDEDLFSVVTTEKFDRIIEVGDPVSQAKIYEAQLVDELILLDLSFHKGKKNKELILDVLKSVAKEVFLPLTIGGGVKTLDDIRALLNNGADKISINSAILNDNNLLIDAARMYGSSTIVASIDYKLDENGIYKVFSHGGKLKHDISPLSWAKKAEDMGAGELLITNIDQDGSKKGLELEISSQISENSNIPVIISGGCGNSSHFVEGFKQCNADAISAGTFFCFQDQSPMQTRGHISNAGFDIRTST